MAEITREKAIDTLKRLKTTHMGDFGWDLTGIEALNFAISDMERVEQLEAENKRLKEDLSRWQEGEWNNCEECCNRLAYKLAELSDGIAKAKAKVERKCIGKQFSEAVIYGMQKAVGIFDEYLGE